MNMAISVAQRVCALSNHAQRLFLCGNITLLEAETCSQLSRNMRRSMGPAFWKAQNARRKVIAPLYVLPIAAGPHRDRYFKIATLHSEAARYIGLQKADFVFDDDFVAPVMDDRTRLDRMIDLINAMPPAVARALGGGKLTLLQARAIARSNFRPKVLARLIAHSAETAVFADTTMPIAAGPVPLRVHTPRERRYKPAKRGH